MSWIISVSSIIVSSLTSYLLYCLPEDGHLSGRNLWKDIVYKTYFTSGIMLMYYIYSKSFIIYIQLMHELCKVYFEYSATSGKLVNFNSVKCDFR